MRTAATAIDQSPAISSTDLLPLVYDELRRLAAAKLRHDQPGQTLQATALVHEAYLRLGQGTPRWSGRNEFFAAAAEAMRRILIERARRQATPKRGGQSQRFDLTQAQSLIPGRTLDLLALDEALRDLEQHHPQAAELVKLRFFAGFGHGEAAEILQVERRVADRLWVLARAWLYRRLSPH